MKTVHFFLGADMRSSHPGLTKLAKKSGVLLDKLDRGTAVVFVNRARDKMKAYSSNGVLSYVRFDDPKRGVDMNALDEIPRAFSSDGTMDYSKALRVALEKRFAAAKKFKELEVL